MSDKCTELYDIWWDRFYNEYKETPTNFETWQAAWQARGNMLDNPELVDEIHKRYMNGSEALLRGNELAAAYRADVGYLLSQLTAIRERMG